MRTRHWTMAMALILVIGGVIGLSIVWRGGGLAGSETNGRVSIGGPFSLLDQHGERVTEKDFAGRFMLIYFGYTYCPDFCPLSLSAMTEALDLLDPVEADQVTPVFISVDPARDTVEALADYAPHFHPRLVALTGSDDEVKAAAKAYRVYYAIPAKEDDSYAVDHSTFIYLMGPDGAYRAHFSHNTTPEEIADRLRTEQKKP